MAGEALLPGDNAWLGGVTFEAWLAAAHQTAASGIAGRLEARRRDLAPLTRA